jgi:NTP pyrophosphatase (non-canonical NTP hydrolase)
MSRPAIDEKRLDYILDTVTKRALLLWKKRERKVWVTPQEALGVITEEYHELIEAIHSNDRSEEFSELLDVAVAAIYAMASQEHMERW